VALVDLDHFKSINDTLGHHAGDVVLQRVAERMSSAIRSKDLLARMGGDEFAVLLLDCDEPQARAFGARLVTALDEPVDVEDLALQISASVGLAQAAEGAAAEDVLQQADVALYRAKSDGVPVAVYAAGGQRPSAVDRLALGRALDVALRTDAIDVHFQVKVPTAGDLPPAMEALARWRDPEHGAVSPAQFIPVAEETGMIKRLTARVLDVALGRCAGLAEPASRCAWRSTCRPSRSSTTPCRRSSTTPCAATASRARPCRSRSRSPPRSPTSLARRP
jgi:diguanylate cyclase (GGDEF)-like protein